jgi:hypothetical protein
MSTTPPADKSLTGTGNHNTPDDSGPGDSKTRVAFDAAEEEPFGDPADDIAFGFAENAEFVAPFTTFELRDKINFALEGIPESFAGISELKSWLTASQVITRFGLFVVLVSCANFAVDTLPSMYNQDNAVTFGIEAVCIGWFTLDLLARFATTREKRLFFTKPQNVVDSISVLPFFVDVITDAASGNTDVTSTSRVFIMAVVLRFTRLARVLKLSKHNRGMHSIFETFRRSQAALSLMFFLLTICIMVGSTAIYFSEQTVQHFDYNERQWIVNKDGSLSPFQSIFHTFWFSLVTITTVGYGDEVTGSLLGKLCTSALLILGVFVIAFPTVILSSNFHDIHNSRVARKGDGEGRRDSANFRTGKDSGSDEELDEDEHKRMLFMRRRKLESKQTTYSFLEKDLAAAALEYRVAGESGGRGIFINGYRAEYAPLLALQREAPRQLEVSQQAGGVREEERPILMSVQPNFPIGVLVDFTLLLHTREAHDAAQRAIDSNLGPAAPLLTVAPRRIKRLTVSWNSPHPMISSASVVTKTFRNPVGKVLLQLYLPFFDALPALMRYNAGAAFDFEVDYEEPKWTPVGGTHMPVAAKLSAIDDNDDDSDDNAPHSPLLPMPIVGSSTTAKLGLLSATPGFL